MFSLKKMTVLCWDDESSISSLSLESQIFNFKDYFSSRIGMKMNFEVSLMRLIHQQGNAKGNY